MCKKAVRDLVVIAIGLLYGATAYAAPRPADREPAERDKAIKAAVATFVAAMNEQNVNAFVEACGIPFSHAPGELVRDADTLRRMYKLKVEGQSPSEAHEVKRIETFKEAKARLGDSGVKGFDEILRDEDYVTTVELQRRGRRKLARLLLRFEEGKPKVVGWRPGSGD